MEWIEQGPGLWCWIHLGLNAGPSQAVWPQANSLTSLSLMPPFIHGDGHKTPHGFVVKTKQDHVCRSMLSPVEWYILCV